MAEKLVRRSTREEALERIVRSPVGGRHEGDMVTWARRELATIREGADEQAPDLALEQQIFDTYGWFGRMKDHMTNDPNRFADMVIEAYQDARTYPEYSGIEIKGTIKPTSSGSATTTYEFRADFGEVVGVRDETVYRKKFILRYDQSHEEGFNEQEAVTEQLISLSYLLGRKMTLVEDEQMQTRGDTLFIEKKPKE